MEKEYKLSMGLIELQDLLEYYLAGKGDYPKKVDEAMNQLLNAIIESMYPEKEIAGKYYIDNVERTYVEKTITGKIFERKKNIDCIMLYNFAVNYFCNKGINETYPEEIVETLTKLKDQLSKYLINDNDEDIEDYYIVDKVKYEKEEVYDGS